jgi:hypothetical protein
MRVVYLYMYSRLENFRGIVSENIEFIMSLAWLLYTISLIVSLLNNMDLLANITLSTLIILVPVEIYLYFGD